MSDAALHASSTMPAGRAVSLGRLGDVVLYFGVFTGSIVMFEPAPYDAILGLAGVLAFVLGLKIPRAMGPLVVLILLFNIGGLLNLTQPMIEAERARTFVAVSLFLAFTCVFFAATIAERPYRLKLIVHATIGAALVAAVLGIVGWGLGIEQLTRYARAKGAFKDPNVFGPFLILPILVLAREFMVKPVLQVWYKAIPLFVLLLGVLLSFSRAAWFLAIFCMAVVGMFVFVVERNALRRLRLVMIAALGTMAMVMGIGALLLDPDMGSFLAQRAKLVQDYDGARLGRLARHAIGFLWSTEMPLGLGPLDFAHYYGEDPHNVYLKAVLGYGWLGFLAYVTLVVWTLKALFPLMLKKRPWQGIAQCVWATLLGHTVIGWIIDSDHWRHFFLLWGLAWGMIALDRAWTRNGREAGVRPDDALATSPSPVGQ